MASRWPQVRLGGRRLRGPRRTGLKGLAEWFRAAYYSWRFVDEADQFPSLWVQRPGRLYVRKGKGARFTIAGFLLVRDYVGGDSRGTIVVDAGGWLEVAGPTYFGDGVRVYLAPGAHMRLGGPGGDFGVTCQSYLLARKDVSVGAGSILSWGVLVTDADWHGIGGREGIEPTVVGDRVWLCPGAQVLKGARIGAGSIVAGNAVVLAGDYPGPALLGGSPAKTLKYPSPEWSR